MKLLRSLLHPCRRVDELVSQSMDEPLGWIDRMRIGMHLRMCGNCQEMKSQVETLHELGADMGAFDLPDDEPAFTLPSQPPRR